ncbi:MAG: hypothetical protein HY778_00330 [Betaproteobacteria bacterium]|nr:hypothetical protein [Betaproteobacteria bacterium]
MGLFDWLRPAPPLDAQTRDLVERTVTAIDPALKTVPGHARRLAPAVRHALDYCAALAQRIPGPYEISRAAFATDPLVHALFGSADDIEAMLARSQCVREHLVGGAAPLPGQCCALLGMRRHEKADFGARLSGGLVLADAPRQTLYFSDHTLAEPGPDLERARARLREAMFDGLLKSFAAHLAEARREHAGLDRERSLESARARGAGSGEMASQALPHAGPPTRRLGELQQRLRASADALSPAQLLETLVQCLAAPEPYLALQPVQLRVDRSGVLCNGGEADGCESLEFVELTSRDPRRWVVVLARIEREDARRAVERLEEARRHIVI